MSINVLLVPMQFPIYCDIYLAPAPTPYTIQLNRKRVQAKTMMPSLTRFVAPVFECRYLVLYIYLQFYTLIYRRQRQETSFLCNSIFCSYLVWLCLLERVWYLITIFASSSICWMRSCLSFSRCLMQRLNFSSTLLVSVGKLRHLQFVG